MDGSQLLWKGKPARLAKGATGRRLTDTMATDGRTLYFAQRRVDLPASIPLDRLRIRVFDENPTNLFGAVLDDGHGVWFLSQRGTLEITPLEGADFETVERFQAAAVHGDEHLRDHRHVWYRGHRVDGLDANQAQILAEHVATDGSQLWLFGRPSADLRAADVTRVWSTGTMDLIRTDDALLRLDGRDASVTTLARTTTTPSPDHVAAQALRALGSDMFAVFETYPQIVTAVDDIDWDAAHTAATPDVDARFDGASIALSAGDMELVRCDADGWYGALCRLWLHQRALPGTLVTYPALGIMRPDGQEFRHRLIQRHRDLFLQYCGAAFAQGAHVGARVMLRDYVEAVRLRRDTPFDGQDALVASLPRALFAQVMSDAHQLRFTTTTNLSTARHVIATGLLDDPDPRVRLEMLELMHGAVLDTTKLPPFFQHVLPALLPRQEDEPLASLREQADAVIEAFIIAALVRAEVTQASLASAVEPLVRRQIARGVNVPLNRGRLIEVLLQQRREDDAAAAITDFTSEFGPDFQLPGLYVNRPLHPTVDDAVSAMRARAAALTAR